jgi:hypothetical protein
MPHRMDTLISEWTSVSKHDPRIDDNSELLSFLGTWLYSQYQPFPEKSPFWDRLFRWLDQIPNNTAPKIKKRRQLDQQVLFNFVPSLLFVAEEELLATYRAAYTGPICRWILKQSGITLDDPNLDERLKTERNATWFGCLAGMDINTFCRVNGVFGQSFRPEFRFLAKFCDMKKLSSWLKEKDYRRIVIVEDIIGTGEQLEQTMGALAKLSDVPIKLVPLFIAPQGDRRVRQLLKTLVYAHVAYEPIFVLPHECLVDETPAEEDSSEIREFREVNNRLFKDRFGEGLFGFGKTYGTLVLTYANCPDNVPPIVHNGKHALFPRASREG